MILSDNLRGALLMMAAMSGFVANDAFMKMQLAQMPIFQALALRGVLTTILLGALLWRQGGGLPRVPRRVTRTLGLRTLAEVCAVWTFMAALRQMPFANVSAILQALPLTVTLGAALFLGQPIGWRRLLAIAVGFAGVLIIIRPGTDGFTVASLLVVVCVVFATARDLLTRGLPPGLSSLAVALWTSTGITTFALAGMLASGAWVPFGWHELGLAAASAVFLAVAYTAIVGAMRTGDIAFIAPFRYTSLLTAIAIGIAVFGEIPDGWTLAGAALVVAMGGFSFWRERRLGKVPLPPQGSR